MYVHFYIIIIGLWISSGSETSKLYDFILLVFVISCQYIPIFAVALFIINPENKTYPYYSLPDSWKNNYTFYILIVFLSFYHFQSVGTFLLPVSIEYMFIFSAAHWLQFPIDILYSKLKSVKRIFKLYKILQILVNFYNQLFAKTFISVQVTILSIISVTGSYESIKYFNKLPFIAYCLFPNCAFCCILCLLIAMNYMAQLFEYSKNFKAELKWFLVTRGQENSYMELQQKKYHLKQLNGLSEIKCYVGSLYFIKKATKGIFLSFLISTTINWIISF